MNLSRFFADKVVVITGSARGIGRETARMALAAGARVVLNGRNSQALAAAVHDLQAPDRTLPVVADVSLPEEAQRLIAATLETWGRIDVLINNAGLSMRAAFADLSPATAKAMVEANLFTAVWTTQAALPALRQSRGRVLFISSLAGVRGFPGVSLYSATKMALTALHQSLRAEEGRRLSAGLIFLAFTENDAGKTVLGADGTAFHHERRWAMTQQKTARAILTAIAHGRKKTTLTALGVGLSWGQALFPGLVDTVVEGSGGKLHSVRRSR